MELTHARFLNFRNISFCDLDLTGQSHFMLASNGQGKSSCLEAIGFISALRSFRTQSTRSLFKKETEEFRLFYQIKHEMLGESKVELQISTNKKILLIDGEVIKRLGDFIGLFPVVPMHSADMMILNGTPTERRRFFDMTLASIDPDYFSALRHYHRTLLERNKTLKITTNQKTIEAFEIELSKYAFQLVKKRSHRVVEIEKILKRVYKSFSHEKESPELVYKSDNSLSSEEAYRSFYAESRERDRIMGATQRGPHRDDYKFSLAIGGAKEYGSDGQQRGLCVALRLAQAELFQKILGVNPILLVDDILGELDPKRKESFWEFCPKEFQVIASGTEFSVGGKNRDWSIWNVSDGSFNKT